MLFLTNQTGVAEGESYNPVYISLIQAFISGIPIGVILNRPHLLYMMRTLYNKTTNLTMQKFLLLKSLGPIHYSYLCLFEISFYYFIT
ncbi:hypothetical protein L873DRAFT_102473 [Choiromyces venosus 120613-1]|uniref:Uncharacterized protein n=1 Tax=Choiromyces venosus 120613-1 TaxID=1336337 RepID=A0A3N4JZM8_9PEZI|nr:hypothetical protein L873DRAFT_102473 [Choiromyces venosus 120613-1]